MTPDLPTTVMWSPFLTGVAWMVIGGGGAAAVGGGLATAWASRGKIVAALRGEGR